MRLSTLLRFTKNFLSALAVFSLVLEQFIFVSTASASALPITPDGTTNTQVTQTASGVDQVNIAAPNAGGLSHNKFESYNVNTGGQIINNFSGSAAVARTGANAVTQTQIGGLVTANPNLVSSGSAKVILNEVTSGNTSQLLGYTEIAGSKADLILANPNGIACLGCGFINTARLLMVAGSSNFDANGNLGFNLKEQANPNLYVPLITIDGLGLDVTRTNGTEIVASSVKLLSSIFGSDSNSVAIRTGEGRYDYATKAITGNNTQNNTDPVFAIDASALAQIQAGQVYLIATKQGVGVKMESEILASSTLNLDANGDIYYKSISVGDTANLRSSGKIQTTDSSSSISAPTINITANQFNNSGLASAYNLNVQNSGTLNNSGNLEALNLNLSNITNINNSGSIFGQNSLAISGTNLTNSSAGSIYSPVDYTIALTGLLTNSGLITSANNLSVNSNQLNNSSEISAQNNLTLSVTSSAANSGNLIAGNALNFSTDSFTNSGATQSGSNSTFNLSSLTNSADSSIYSTAALNLNLSSSLNNLGSISAQGNLSVTGSAAITNSNQILSNSDLSISATSLNNSSLIASLTKSLTLALTGDLQNDGEIDSVNDLNIDLANLSNSGNILSNAKLNLNATSSLNNSGNFQSAGDGNISSSSFSNSGLIKSVTKATVSANSFTNQLAGAISANDDLTINAISLSNFGAISSQNNFIANSSSLTNSGSIYSANNFNITNSANLTNSGVFYSDGSLTILSNNITNNSAAWIYGSKDISIASNLDLTNAGNIQATTDLTVLVGRNSNNSGNIVGDQITFNNSGQATNSGSIASGSSINLSASNLTNSGEISAITSGNFTLSSLTNQGSLLTNNNLIINSASITNSADATLASINQALTLNISDYLNNAGTIFAKTNFTLANAASGAELNSVTNDGDISFNNLVNGLLVKNFTNSGNFVSGQDLTITSSNSFNNSGTLNSSSDLNLNTTSLTNSGEISASEQLTIVSSGDLTNSGNILSNAALAVSANNLTNNSSSAVASLSNSATLTITNNLTNNGQISSNNDLGINTKNLTNTGDILSNNKLTITAQNSVSNSGNLQSVSDFSLTSASLTNSNAIKSFGKGSMTSATINNQDDGLIYSADDLTLISSTSFTNSGAVLSGSKINLTSALAVNSGEVFASDDLALNLTDTLTNSGSLSSLGNLNISGNSDITNTNQILSNGTLSITAANLISSNLIQSNDDLSLNLVSLTNTSNIVSGGAFTIAASGNIQNSGILESADNFTINASSFSNSASSLILAGGDLTVRASSINNQNTKPSTSNITSGIVSANGAVNLLTDTLNNNSGLVAGKSTSVSALSAGSVNLYNTLGAFISTAAISLDLGSIDYTITGTVTANNVDITANNIINQGNVTASDFIKLNATGNSGVAGSGNITNEYVGGNASVLASLAAGTYIDFTAKNNINNYGTISATTDLTLTSTLGNINNYSTGKITGGDGTTTINALSGAFNNTNQTSLLTADNNAIFNIKDLNNTGEISVANDLTTNITNNLSNNATALIWSGNSATFNVANTFLNNQADIYADNNLTIRKNTSLDKTTLVKNISGNIETYAGDITIAASTIINQRSSMKTQGNTYTDRAWGQDHETHHDSSHTASINGTAGIVSNISSGKNLNISAINLTNDASNILSVGNLALNASTITNTSYFFESYYQRNANWWCGGTCVWRGDWNQIAKQNYYSETYNAYIKSGGLLSGSVTSKINNNTIAQYSAVSAVEGQSHSTTINKIDSYTLAQTGAINVDLSSITSAISNNSGSTSVSDLGLSTTSTSSPSSVSVTKGSIATPISASSSVSTSTASVTSSSLSVSTSGTVFSGNFKINLDPSATTPLVESRSQFTDASKFFGSSYYFNQLGLNGSSVLADLDRQTRNTNTRMLGDSFVETKLIMDQLKTLTNDSLFLSKTTTDPNQQIKELLDNSVNQFAALGLNAEDVAIHGLTSAQANSLTKDIVTFELTTVNGVSVLAPKIYLSQDSRNRLFNSNSSNGGTAIANNSVIFGKNSVTIDSPYADLLNNGSIVSGGDLNLNLASLVNKTNSSSISQIIAGNNLNITANSGDIKNIGANIGSTGSLNLTTLKGNILNTAIVQTDDANLLSQGLDSYQLGFNQTVRNSHNISSALLQNASIKGGSISINAANDFTNSAANISTAKNTLADGSTTSGNLSISAGDDINISTLQLRNRTEVTWGTSKKGGISVSDKTSNLSSDIDASGSLTLFASGTGTDSETSGKLHGSNIQITGSNLSATDSITLAAKDDVNISAAQNTSYFESQSWKKGLTVSKSSVSGSQSTTNVLSNLTSDSGNISITSGSDTNLIGAKLKAEDVAVNAGDEVNIYSVSDQNKSWASSTKSRNFSGITGGLVGVSFLANVAPLTLGGAILANQGLSTNDSSKSSSTSTEKTSNLASVIDATGAVSIASNQDLTVSGSDISGKTGSLVSDQGSVNILAAQEIEKTSSSSSETARATNVPGFKGVKHTSSETSENITNIASNLTFTDSLAIQTNGNSTDSTQKADINVKGSNLTVTDGDLTIASKGNVTIENAVDSTFTESSSKKRNETTKSFSTSTDYVETAASSNLSANNINISSLGDTTIQGSNIDTKENLVIGSFAIAQNSDGTYQKDSNGNYVTTAGTTVDNLTIKDADLKEYHYAQSGKGYTGVAAVGMRALPYALAPLQIASSLAKDYMSTYYPDALENFVMKATPLGWSMTAVDKAGDKLGAIKISESTETRADKSNSHASNINVGGSMMTNSVGDTLVKGSNLNVSGDLLANSLGSFTVAAGTNTESTTSQSSYETAGKFHSEYNSTKLNYRAGVTKDFVEEGTNSSSSTVASSNVNIGGSALVNSSDEFALVASNFVTGSSAEIISKNNLNISDGQNKQSDSSYTDKLTLDTGVQVGNAYADAAYAVVDAVKAQKAVKDAYDKLNKIEDLHDEGMASSKAVERAEYQVVLALINAGLSSAAAMQAVGNAGAAASTSMGTGFYGSVYADITKLKSTTTSEYSQSVASNLVAGDSISLTSGAGDINITGSNVSATNGDLNLTAMLGNLNVNAGESTASQSYKMKSQSLGGSVGNNGFSANIGISEAESSQDQTTYTNSQLLAENGTLNINTAKDTNLFGANLLASNVNMDVGGNLLLKSRQNLSESDSYNIGMSLGISGDSSGANGGSVGFNLGNGYSNRAWVDQVSSIIGTNSVNINVDNNTNIVGAVIANKDKDGNDLGNLNLSTASLTYSDLKNFSVSESNQLGLNLQVGKNPNNPTANGNLAINLSMQGSESSSDTKATIGQGNITVGGNLNDETKLAGLNRDIANTEQNKKTVVTSDFDASLKIDLRLIAAAGNLAIGNTDKAAANWNSYAAETQRGANITYDALAIPLTSLGKTISGDVNASDAILATGKNYQNLYQLAYNQNIVLTDLAGEGKLIAYDGNQLDGNAQARYAEGFYDRNSDTAAINADSNKSDSQLAGTAAHEGAHRMFNSNGQSYTQSEESASHIIGDFAESRWDTYQSGNTSLRASLPTSSINFNNNFYANNVKFGNDVNPLIVDKLANAIKPGLGDSMNRGLKNFKENSLNSAADKYVNSNDPVEKAGLAVMLGIGSVALPESVTDLELSAALGGASKAYAPEIAAGANKVDDVASGLWNKLFGSSTSTKTNPVDFYVAPNGDTMPATAYRYMDSHSTEATRALETNTGELNSYFGYEKLNSGIQAQDRYQILPQWSNAKVRGEFDTLQLFDNKGNLNTRIPRENGDLGPNLEPFANYYPKTTHGNGGGQQSKPIIPQQIKYNNVNSIGE